MKTFIVDAFTDRPFRGNPAGVCLVDQENAIDDHKMLKIAQELGFSETAFVSSTSAKNSASEKSAPCYDIRYFSPVMEIPLCGHATLASAHVLFRESAAHEIDFVTRDGVRLRTQKRNAPDQLALQVVMSFPAYKTTQADAPPALLDALGIREVTNVAFNAETNILLLQIASAKVLRELQPNFALLRASHETINGVLVTAEGDDTFDFHSRYFWPWSGTNEDPVTGGTHTFLAPYWAKRLGRSSLQSYQASSRGGFMSVEVPGDGTISITGQATIVLSGHLEQACLK
ncbi:MAG: PhzF family phenazine biosynthesis protein [Aureliella sp.]